MSSKRHKTVMEANNLATFLRIGSRHFLPGFTALLVGVVAVIPLSSAQASQITLTAKSGFVQPTDLSSASQPIFGTGFQNVVGLGSKSDTSVFRLLSTDPVMGYFPASAAFIKLSFNKKLSTSILVSGTHGLISSHSVNKSALMVTINSPLSVNSIYQLKIRNIRDVEGQKIKDMVLSFKPRLLPESSLSSEQMQALMNGQQQYNSVMGDKLISLLPFHSGGGDFLVSYNLKYSGQTTIPIVIITAPDQKRQNEALSWIRLVGADPSKYKIQYVTGPVP